MLFTRLELVLRPAERKSLKLGMHNLIDFLISPVETRERDKIVTVFKR
jgi:hypothetical protein